MEFVERFFGIKTKRQEKLISELGINDKLRKELVGPEHEEAAVVRVDNNQFLQLLQSRKPTEVLSKIVHRSDTHVAYDLYIDLGLGVKVKTAATQVDYNYDRNLFSDLNEMGYSYMSIEPKTKMDQHSWDSWGAYRMEETKNDS